MAGFFNWLAFQRHRIKPGDASFSVVSFACTTAGIALLTLPFPKVAGPSLSVIYNVLPARAWGVLFLAAGLVALFAVLHPTMTARKAVYYILLPLGCAWTTGLLIPFLSKSTANFWAPLVWLTLTSIGYIAYAFIPLDAPFYRELRHDTVAARVRNVVRHRKDRQRAAVGSHAKGK